MIVLSTLFVSLSSYFIVKLFEALCRYDRIQNMRIIIEKEFTQSLSINLSKIEVHINHNE